MTTAGTVAPLPAAAHESFRRAGLGKRYFDMSLTQFGAVGNALNGWINSADGRFDLKNGIGRSIYGEENMAHELFMVLARGCHARGFPVKIISLPVLVKQLDQDSIDPGLETASALFLYPFFDAGLGSPLTSYQTLAVESLLIERMDDARAVFTLSRNPLAQAKTWWSKSLLSRLHTNNVEIGVRTETDKEQD